MGLYCILRLQNIFSDLYLQVLLSIRPCHSLTIRDNKQKDLNDKTFVINWERQLWNPTKTETMTKLRNKYAVLALEAFVGKMQFNAIYVHFVTIKRKR